MGSPAPTRKTKQQLLQDNRELRKRMAELESLIASGQRQSDPEPGLAAGVPEGQCPPASEHDLHGIEQVLRQDEQRYRLLFDRNPDGVFAVDTTGRFVLANASCESISGYPIIELLQKTFMELCAPDQLAQTVAQFEHNFIEPVHLEFETALIRKDGRRVELWVAGEPIVVSGKLMYVHCTAKDITDRKLAIDQLRTTLESIADGFFACDKDWRFVYINAAAERILGISREGVLGKIAWEVFPLTVGTELEHEYRLAAAGEIRDFEHFYEPWGRWFQNRCFPREGGGMSVYFEDITERKAAEKALKNSEATLHLAERAAKAGSWDWDIAAGTIRWDPEQFSVFGLDPAKETASFETWRRIVHPEDEPDASARIDAALKEHTTLASEYRIILSDGTIRWIYSAGEGVYDAQGTPTRMIGICHDITDRKRAEAELRETEERLRFGLEASNIGAWDLDLTNQTAFRSLGHDRIFGYAELLPKWTYEIFLEHVLPEDRDAVDAKFRHAMESQSNWSFECRIRRQDGEIRWIWAAGRHYSDAGGMRRMAGIVQDVTGHKAAEQELRESRNQLEVLTHNLHSGVALIDEHGKFSIVNAAFLRMFDLSAESDIKNVNDRDWGQWRVFDEDGTILDVDEHPVRKAALTGKPVRNRLVGVRSPSDHELKWMLISAAPILKADGRMGLLICTYYDITELKRAEASQSVLLEERGRLLESERFARRELERANRLKDEFLANLSHELRTPLSAILGWTQILKRDHADRNTALKGLEVIERNTRVQTQLVSDILDVSRIISGKMRLETENCDPVLALEAAIDSLAPAAQAKNIRIERLIEPIPGPVLGDPSRLQQTFWNLLSNAIKFTPAGGRVQLVLRRTDSRIEIIVRDNGKGINPEFLPHIFERFRQADSSAAKQHAGLGLGLAIVKHLVELHGGVVTAESPGEGRGATFTVSLPIIALARQEDLEPGAAGVESFHTLDIFLNAVKVLVVDDEHDTREILKRLLEERGADVSVADSAADAIAMIQELRPDVLVSDIGMPGEDGYQMIRRIRELPPEAGGLTPALALTAYSRLEDRKRALFAGYQYHLAKPVEPAELITTLGVMTGRLPKRHDQF
jgi:PAS domain S-box-containing protein